MIASANGHASGLWDVSAVDYHADRSCVSHSSLEVFRRSIPLYHAVYVSGRLEPDPPTAAMLTGSALHCRLLEPLRWAESVAVIPPDINRRTNAGKAEWERFLADSEGKIVLTDDQYDTVMGMAGGVLFNPLAAELLDAPGKNECSVRWTDDRTKVACKARFDRLLDVGVVVDLKTSSDPTPETWSRAAAALGYHRQAALYLAGAGAISLRHDAAEFFHIVVGSSEPYECIVYQLDAEALELGREQNHRSLVQIDHCRKTGDWSSRWTNHVHPVCLPKWAHTS